MFLAAACAPSGSTLRESESGAPSFWLLFLGDARKSNQPPVCHRRIYTIHCSFDKLYALKCHYQIGKKTDTSV